MIAVSIIETSSSARLINRGCRRRRTRLAQDRPRRDNTAYKTVIAILFFRSPLGIVSAARLMQPAVVDHVMSATCWMKYRKMEERTKSALEEIDVGFTSLAVGCARQRGINCRSANAALGGGGACSALQTFAE